ncbi:MAG TPA: tRNA pseudouridine(55) synthase TruB, partial [Candidatus Binataceae bacterium]
MDGILLIDKPAGISSAEVVRRIKPHVKPARVGHLGTLDPFATGLLPILIGEATKLAPFLEGGDKHYAGVIRLGAETDTLDRDGAVIRTAKIPQLEASRLAQAAARFTGLIEQTPPIYSAIKREGVPLYKRARRGEDVAPPNSRRVEIKHLTLETIDADSIRFDVSCTTGTYIRALARDIGDALDSAAHLVELRRLRNGNFDIEGAITLESALASLKSPPVSRLTGLAESLPGLAAVTIGPTIEARLRNGDSRALDRLVTSSSAIFKCISADGRLIAIARATSPLTAKIV